MERKKKDGKMVLLFISQKLLDTLYSTQIFIKFYLFYTLIKYVNFTFV